jgi:hypothetical protein
MSPLGAVCADGDVAEGEVELAAGGDIAGGSAGGVVDCAKAPDSISALSAVMVAKVFIMGDLLRESCSKRDSRRRPDNAGFLSVFRNVLQT